MGFDQQGSLVFCVKLDKTNNKWNVLEEGIAKPLASFDTQKDASEYACEIARTKEGSRVKIFDEKDVQTAEVEMAA